MTKASKNPEEFLPLTPAVFHILLCLADGEKHGYLIMRGVREMTDGAIQMGPGTLYGTVKRLLDDGLIEECEDRPDPEQDDERRRYYRLTTLGRSVLGLEVRRYKQLVALGKAKGLTRNVPNFQPLANPAT